MFAYEDIVDLLSPQAKNSLSNLPTYEVFSEQTAQLIKEYTNVDINPTDIKPEWAKMPFVFIIEFLLNNKLNAQSPEQQTKVDANYKAALEILKNHRVTTVLTNTNVGIIGDTYNVDF